MSELETGCHCSAGHAPCWWCESLSEEEVAILDSHGYEILVWLQQNSFILEGQFEYENIDPDMREREFLSAISVATDSIAIRNGRTTQRVLGLMPLHDTTMAMLKAETIMASRPVPAATITSAGCLVPAALKTAEVFTLDRHAHTAKRRRHAEAYGAAPPKPRTGNVIPLKRSP